MSLTLKQRVQEDMKTAMRSRDKERLGVIRMIMAAIKQIEIDDRLESLDDPGVLGVLRKMLKQRRDSRDQFQSAGRQDLAEKEAFEIDCIEGYLPQALGEEEIDALIEAAIRETGAVAMKDMGKLMALLKTRTLGRADMGQVSARVKQHLARTSP